MTSKSDIVDALQEAGDNVTWREFRELDNGIAPSTVQSKFGSWNEGKKAAGLEINLERTIDEPPETIDMSQERWEELSGQMRGIYRRRDKSAKLQLKEGCAYCGYDEHPAALQWHHTNPDEKEMAVSTMIQNYGWDSVKDEIDKCICLCANCHRVEEDDTQQKP